MNSPNEIPDVVYADGGVIGPNPSKKGGTWAFVYVSNNAEVKRRSGVVLPADIGMDTVSNNLTEFLALLHCIEGLPDGWAGTAHTDSMVTLRRFHRPFTASMKNIPDALVSRLQAASRRLGKVSYQLLSGHPTQADLARGHKNRVPVSHWNVLCDHLCGEESQRVLAGLGPRKVDMTLFSPERGNCLQASIATILQLPLDDVPHFCRDFPAEWLDRLQGWAAAHHKLAVACLTYGPPVAHVMGAGLMTIASGPSPRYEHERPELHAVVYKGRELYHDPHPHRTGIIDINDVLVFMPLDPSKRR